MSSNLLTIGLAQISPVWLDKEKTIEKILNTIENAANKGCELVVFGEALLPGYPFWLALTGGAEWDTKVNKELHAHYANNAIQIEAGELDKICELSAQKNIAIYLT